MLTVFFRSHVLLYRISIPWESLPVFATASNECFSKPFVNGAKGNAGIGYYSWTCTLAPATTAKRVSQNELALAFSSVSVEQVLK